MIILRVLDTILIILREFSMFLIVDLPPITFLQYNLSLSCVKEAMLCPRDRFSELTALLQ